MKKILPIKHLSARVPWHDNKWNGKTCCNVLDNSFCRILPLIDQRKNPETEPNDVIITEDKFPPCISEKGTFLSPSEYSRELKHAWTDINPMFKDFIPGIYYHKPYSLNAVPFLWMMKNKATEKNPHYSEKAEVYELDYNKDLEEEIDKKLGFEGNNWVQHPENQRVLLDSFFECLRPQRSLIFFYCKDTPFSEPNERVIVGVAKVKNEVGPILEYKFNPGYKGHRSHPWDRCVEHTLTPKNTDGFLLPYHEILSHVKENGTDIELNDFAVIAPDYKQFSYASELVEHDTAIDALLSIAESLKKSSVLLEKPFKAELEWIDNEISKIWDMRGAFPGMGAVLGALQIEDGNTIAWEIEKYILQKDGDLLQTNSWTIFEESIAEPSKYIKTRGENLFNATIKRTWQTKPAQKKEFYFLLSRCQLNNEQANHLVEFFSEKVQLSDVITNFYLAYEKTRYNANGISFKQIDKALLPPEKIRIAFPLPEISRLSDNLDERRVRAVAISILEEASNEGHTLLSFEEVLERMQEKSLDESFPIDNDVLEIQMELDFFKEEILSIPPSKSNPTCFLKLNRLDQIKTVIRQRLNISQIVSKPYSIEKDWLAQINNYPDFPGLDQYGTEYDNEIQARTEKAEALKILTNYRFSVLIGPAGSGKTSLLKIFEGQEEIQKGGILKLAPTGKARVKLGHDAKTVAQFLYPHRYDIKTGTYYLNEEAPRFSSARNIIIDESSMLTEEQLAAVFDALGPVDRIILVGDYRQLPPIGTGRPFVDIVNELKPFSFAKENIYCAAAYAELRKIKRQSDTGDYRWDVALSRCFSDEPSKEDLEIFNNISSASINSNHIRLEKWYDSKDFRELFEKVIVKELLLEESDIEKSFNERIGAKDINGYQYFNYDFSEKVIEEWQVISPVNGYGYGVKEVNKFFQTTYRQNFIALAHNIQSGNSEYHQKRKIAKPKGSDNIVYGDKVINLRNTTWENWKQIRPYEKKNTSLNYFANGEIGVITGEFRGKFSKGKGDPNIEVTFSTQPGYSYVFDPKWLKEDGDFRLELAYAITVHKSQGSGFGTVFFVLPSKGAILSRELLYTALTRQEQKIIILHQGDFRDFIRFASTEASSTARRFTDLFHLPDLKQLNKKWYDARYINISERGEPMISKNEVIIANCLNKYKKQITYSYEDKLKLETSDRTIKPDFTIDNLFTNKRFYWEHLGMMTKTDYREKWLKKLEGYKNDGFVLHTEATDDDDKVLIITEENPNGGINSKAINELVIKYILEQ